MLIKNQFSFVLIVILIAECSEINDFNKDYMRISTDKDVYSQSIEEKINITAVNVSFQDIYYLSPSFLGTLQRYDDGDWIDLGPWYTIVAEEPRRVTALPGDTIPVIYLESDSEFIEGIGKYRIHLKLFKDRNLKQLIPFEDRVSNIFEITQ